MVSRGVLVLSCHGLVWLAAALALWAAGAAGSVRRHGYDTATPHAPPYTKHKYIPLNPNYDPYEPTLLDEPAPPRSRLAPSELVLTALRTALDVVRNMNAKKRANSARVAAAHNATTDLTINQKANTTAEARGFYDEYDDHHYHDPTTTTTTVKPKPRYTDPWAGYYDWIINEGSFKFWSVFQLFTAALLLYACFSAIYYAKFNPILPDYDREYDDYFLERTVGRQARSLEPAELPSGLGWINPRTFQFILDAIATHYQDE